jgi:hypothetical protein
MCGFLCWGDSQQCTDLALGMRDQGVRWCQRVWHGSSRNGMCVDRHTGTKAEIEGASYGRPANIFFVYVPFEFIHLDKCVFPFATVSYNHHNTTMETHQCVYIPGKNLHVDKPVIGP